MSKPSWGAMPHPATMFFALTLAVAFGSWICDVYGLRVWVPGTKEEIHVQSLLSPEGIRWALRNIVSNFTGFAPLGQVLVAMFGIGVAQHAGFAEACIRLLSRRGLHPDGALGSVIILGLLSNVAGDAGYVFLLPAAATLFLFAGLHPVAGVVVAYVSVGCGYSANVVLTTLDAQLASVTQEAADTAGLTAETISPLCNYLFFAASALLLGAVVFFLSRLCLLPSLGSWTGRHEGMTRKQLSSRERRALTVAFVTGGIYAGLTAWLTFSAHGILRSVSGGLTHSPFIEGILFLLSLGIGLMGGAYGFVSGRYRTDADLVSGLEQPARFLGGYLVMAFFAAQMLACLRYSRLDTCLAVAGADLLLSVPVGRLGSLLLFIVFTAVVNLLMVSATSKWTFMAFIFVPVLADAGIAPEAVQCAFRIGDSATNVATPFMLYLPLALACIQQYVPSATFGTLWRLTWRFSVCIFAAWILLFAGWYLMEWPWGI